MNDNIKEQILLTLAETLSFAKVRKKVPGADDLAIKETLLEASRAFIKPPATKPRPAATSSDQKVESLIIYTDGASKGNPGIASAGVVIKDEHGNNIALIKKYLGVMTNNSAEYQALLIGLAEAVRRDCRKIQIFMDSELIVKQIKGQYRVKNENLKPMYLEAIKFLKKIGKYDIVHIVRSKNKLADSLANEAIKEHLSS